MNPTENPVSPSDAAAARFATAMHRTSIGMMKMTAFRALWDPVGITASCAIGLTAGDGVWDEAVIPMGTLCLDIGRPPVAGRWMQATA